MKENKCVLKHYRVKTNKAMKENKCVLKHYRVKTKKDNEGK